MLRHRNKLSYLLQTSNGVIPMIVIPLLSRSTSPGFMGDYFMFLSVVSVAQVFVEYGFNMSGIRSFVKLRNDNKRETDKLSLIASISVAKLVIALLVTLIFTILLQFSIFTDASIGYKGIFFGFVLSVTNIWWVLFAINETYIQAMLLLVLRIIAIIPFLQQNITINVAIAATLMPTLISNVLSALIVAKKSNIRIRKVRFKISIFEQMVGGWSIFANSAVVSLVTAMWPMLLSNFISKSDVGLYGISDKIMRGMMTLVSPFQFFLLARGSQYSLIQRMLKSKKLAFLIFSCIAMVPCFFVLIPNDFISRIFGNFAAENRGVLNGYAIGFTFGAVNLVLYAELVKINKESIYKYIFLASATAASFLLPFFNMSIYIPLVTEAMVMAVLMFWFYKSVRFLS